MANRRQNMGALAVSCVGLSIALISLVLAAVTACSGVSPASDAGTGGARACTDCTPTGDMTYTLPSPAGVVLWTTTTMDKVLREATLPTTTGTTINLSAAKNEFEPFQIVAHADAATTATLQLSAFTGPSTDGFLLYPPDASGLVTSIRWELMREGVEDFEYLLLANGGSMPLTPSVQAAVDATVKSAVSSTTSYTRDSAAFKHLRDQLVSMIEGKVNGYPRIRHD